MHKQNHTLDRFHHLILWEKWVLANAVASITCLFLIATLSKNSYQGNINSHSILLFIASCNGIIFGFAQWLVLRSYVRNALWWIPATILGTLVSTLVITFLSFILAFAIGLQPTLVSTQNLYFFVASIGAIAGAVLGLLQGIVLKALFNTTINQVGWWIVANAFAWSLGVLIAFIGAGIHNQEVFNLNIILISTSTGATVGSIVGIITAIALIFILKVVVFSKNN
ncbi:MAG: hypothetical protein KME64_23750 [Scytonematopsis contorta HA4267-MV1]|jgi:hypothetical protein|nr:hypothetical protein [Scytonematopsis contorta HA4267-MV1]